MTFSDETVKAVEAAIDEASWSGIAKAALPAVEQSPEWKVRQVGYGYVPCTNCNCMVPVGQRHVKNGYVKMPSSKEEAVLMVNLGICWLEQNASEALNRKQVDVSEDEAIDIMVESADLGRSDWEVEEKYTRTMINAYRALLAAGVITKKGE